MGWAQTTKQPEGPVPNQDAIASITWQPLDVPAIHGQQYWCGGPSPNDLNNGVPKIGRFPKHPVDHHGSCPVPPPIPEWTCKDKHRILEEAEDGKHWCRKVQSKVGQ
jgi:hypothetical protein